MDRPKFRHSFRPRLDEMLGTLSELVRHESPSREKAALDALGANLADRLGHLGGAVEIIANGRGGDHILSRFPGTAGRRPALVLGHFDTVWPRGTIERLPFRVENGRIFGPGVYDMKAGLTLFLQVMAEFSRSSLSTPRPIWSLFTSDEEIGSPTSRRLIEEVAGQCEYVLVLEPPLADGSLKTSRKGVGRFDIEIQGKAAHAGVAPEDGRSAIVELAHQVLRVQELQDSAAGTTLNVGVIRGGTTPNVVPALASAEVNVRVSSMAEAERVAQAIRSLRPVTPDVRIAVDGDFNRPPMERSPAIAGLFEEARRIGLEVGLELSEGSTGGGSDGNFTAALGIPTLDGLGVRGGGAHADDEHILIDSLPERAALLASLLLELQVELMRTNSPSLRLDDEITIRRAESVADYRACQDAQRRAWGIAENGYLVPVATMVGANLHGGLVLGAFLASGEAVAMSFAFLGRSEGRLCLYSQLTGVVPGYQSRGLGYQIKLLQREFARAEAIESIAWAFDPLQAGNAHFNLARLGASACRYIDNMYGERTDTLNAGVPTDRLIAEWDTTAVATVPIAIPPDAASRLPRLIETEPGPSDQSDPVAIPQPIGIASTVGAPRLLLEIPADIARLRREWPELAEQWRGTVMSAFRTAFDAGYRAVQFIRDEVDGGRRGFYVLDLREFDALHPPGKTV